MKMILILTIMCLSLVASELKKDEKIYQINDKDYIIRCIEGYKWIQFFATSGIGRGTNYFPSGNPQQMFYGNFSNLPIKCDETK